MKGMEYQLYILLILFFLFNVGMYSFIDAILENRHVKKWMMYVIYIFNTLFFMKIMTSENRSTTMTYSLIILCLFIEVLLFYKDFFMRICFVVLAVTIHVMTVRAIILSVFSLLYNIGLFEVNKDIYEISSLNLTIVLLLLILLVVNKNLSSNRIKLVTKHKEQLKFMTTWLIFANAYFLFNSLIFTEMNTELFLKYDIIAVSFTIFFALYTVLFFTINVGKLLNYKEKSDFLESVVEDEKQYKNSLMDQALIGFEINLTEDTIVYGFGEEYIYIDNKSKCYSEMLKQTLPFRVYQEELDKVFEFMSVENLIECYHRGEVEQSLEYRGTSPGRMEYTWVKAYFNLYKASTTDCIMAFTYVKDIDIKKQLELEIKNRSERDMLTGLYNHAMTKQLVNEFLESQKEPPYKGALLIIDIDNFKLINDNFGHSFGDEVLQSIAKKLISIFRCHRNASSNRMEDDIVSRVGGDEFMVFVKNLDQDGLKARTQNVCDLIKTTYTTLEGKEITISASIGVKVVSERDEDFKELYAKADVALYNAKRDGKNGYSFYQGESFQGYSGNR